MSHDRPRFSPDRYRLAPGLAVDLSAIDTGDTGNLDRKDGEKILETAREEIIGWQEKLYAEGKRSLLIVLQAMDSGGKDGTIKHVLVGVNPQGCHVTSFKQPTSEELAHDFLWRIHPHAPAKGMMAVFNRSYYEDVLVVRVKDLVPDDVWRARYEQINDFERLLAASGTTVVKFFLHISRDEQKERLEARLEDPDKRWKFALGDLTEWALWDDYQAAYAEALGRCSTDLAPWIVVPADHKWYRNAVIARTLADTLARMAPDFPEPTEDLDGVKVK